jgi:hypothetical protein
LAIAEIIERNWRGFFLFFSRRRVTPAPLATPILQAATHGRTSRRELPPMDHYANLGRQRLLALTAGAGEPAALAARQPEELPALLSQWLAGGNPGLEKMVSLREKLIQARAGEPDSGGEGGFGGAA